MLNSEDHLNVVSENVTANLPKSLRDQLMELGLKGSATSPESQKTPVSSTTAKPQDNDINTIRALSAIGKGMVTVNRAALPKRFSISTIRAYIRTHDTNGELSALEIFYAFVGFGKVYGYDEAAINYQRLILPLSNFAGEIAAQLALDNTDETEISHFRQSVSLLASQEAISMEPFRAAESSVLRPHWERLGAQQKQVLEMARQLACTDFSTSFFTPVLNALDISLAISWSDRSELKVLLDDKPPYRIDTNSLIKTCGRHYVLGQMLSARAAEKVAMEFYREYGDTVRDISIEQISNPLSAEWRHFDICIDNRAVDVKNARWSRSNRNSYVEYCVPRFKRFRHYEDITIAGVLSPYLWPSALLGHDDAYLDKTVVFLGEVTKSRLLKLKETFSNPDIMELDFARTDSIGAASLPPWIFEYPSTAYTKRNHLLRTALGNRVLSCQAFKEIGINAIPLYLSCDLMAYKKMGLPLRRWETSFIDKLHRNTEVIGLNLSVIFLTILEHFLEIVSGHIDVGDERYTPARYSELLFFDNLVEWPLGVRDPLEAISGLITALTTLWDKRPQELRRFKFFKLRSWNTLLGKEQRQATTWRTLLAYCGGPLNGVPKCGTTPLVLGTSEWCPECGRLICPNCGFCNFHCGLVMARSKCSGSKAPCLTASNQRSRGETDRAG